MKKWMITFSLAMVSVALLSQEQQIEWTTGTWDADSLGNHRIVVEVPMDAPAVFCHIPWRRKDVHPDEKNIIIQAEKSGEQVHNILRLDINREYGQLVFEPINGKGTYYLYHMPYRTSGSRNYPTVQYVSPVDQTAASWKKKYAGAKDLPVAQVTEIQSINAFHSFYPMEVIATQDEVQDLLSDHPDKDYLLFPEDRMHPIKMWSDLPMRWTHREYSTEFRGQARRNEYFAFQIGLYASQQDMELGGISYTGLKSIDGHQISSAAFHCFNLSGIDWTGEPLVKDIQVAKGQVQALWIGLMIPEDAEPGLYSGSIYIYPKQMPPQLVPLYIEVLDESVADHGDSQPELHSRLRWLDSQIGADDDIVDPYTPVGVSGNQLRILGRTLTLAANGLPEQISSSFTQEMTTTGSEFTDLLYTGMVFKITYPDGRIAYPEARGTDITKQGRGLVTWRSKARAGNLEIIIHGRLEADGYLEYEIDLHSAYDIEVADISLVIPVNGEVAEYMLGLGRRGGYVPEHFKWKWDPYFNNDGPWIGSVNLGLQCSFRDDNYERPLNTNFYQQKPLNMPPSWYNDGKGGILMERTDNQYLIQAYSGNRTIKKDETLHFNAQFLITPFHTIDTKAQWDTRYYHRYEPIDSILAYGGNTINVHHATDINPYINYPFLTPDIMKDYVEEAHRKDARVKFYYTVRELSNRCPEIWALKSLGDEILSYGSGGGYSWLQEHLDGNYIAAWFVPDIQDAAVINSGVSRWHNYYLEGVNWLVDVIGIDGLYIDDVAFDRSVMKRVRKVLKRGNPDALIDLHSANQFNHRDGFANSANLYMEHFPYIDRLWFGEYFDYDAGPEYWMTEIAGIPFGLMGEMLWEGGNQWRGLLYGMTSRAPWSGDPSPIWKAWDDFGIAHSEMIGYWVDDCPVQTGRPDVLATVYQSEGKSMIALASWAAGPARVELEINWEALGLDPEQVVMYQPEIRDFQEAKDWIPGESFTVPEKKGYLIILETKK